jgi:hypothetical protein
MRVLLVKTVRSSAVPGNPDVVAYFTDQAIRPPAPGTMLDGDAVGNVVFEDRVLVVPTLSRELAGDLTSLTAGVGVGQLELANGDGALDATRGDVWRAIKVWLWDDKTPLATALFLFSADCGRAEYLVSTSRPRRVIVSLTDVMARLDRPLSANLYAGTNNGTTILYEGSGSGIARTPKPWLVGDMESVSGGVDCPPPHIPGVQVNGPTLTYQLHDGPIEDAVEVLDRGIASGLDYEGDFIGTSFDTAVLPAASYCIASDRGLVKITTGLIGPISFGARRSVALPNPYTGSSSEPAAPGRCVADVMAFAATSGGAKGTLTFNALQLRAALGDVGPCGWYYGAPINVREAVAPLTRAGGGVLAARRDGSFMAVAVRPPKAVADIIVSPDVIVAISQSETTTAPVGQVRIGWGNIWTTFEGSALAPSAANTEAASALREQWRYAVADNATTKARAVDWRAITIETALRSKVAAEALAATLLGVFGLRADGQAKRTWIVTLEASAANLARDLGDTVRLILPDIGLDERMILVGERLCSPRRDLIQWIVWG